MFAFDYQYLQSNTVLKETDDSIYYPYQDTPDDRRWAVKMFTTNRFDDLNYAMQEAVLGFKLDHPSLLPVQGYFLEYEKGAYKLFTKVPRVQKTLENLIQDHIKNKIHFTEKEILRHCSDFLSAIEYLDSKNIAHRNIQPANIFIDEQGSIKITDFSQAKLFIDKPSGKVKEVVGSCYYLSPELNPILPGLMNKELSRCDMWSIGVIMLEMCLLKVMFINVRETKQKKKEIVRECLEEIGKKYGQELVIIVGKLLCLNPDRRESISSIKEDIKKGFNMIVKKEIEKCKLKITFIMTN